jgi:hypothetical protein
MLTRRQLLQTSAASLVAPAGNAAFAGVIDFRYAPLQGQTAFCFPDDHYKSLVGYSGDLRYRYSGNIENFGLIVAFGLEGMEREVPSTQKLESAATPVVRTRLEYRRAFLDLTTFATRSDGEGRVDQVVFEVKPRAGTEVYAAPLVRIFTPDRLTVRAAETMTEVVSGEGLVMAANAKFGATQMGPSFTLTGKERPATSDRPFRILFRLPQEKQSLDRLREGFTDPDHLLGETRRYWRGWTPSAAPVTWTLPGHHGEFLTACSRNILQAREVKNGKLTFQVGPTVYRGLWVVDGHFILEAARYLGFDKEAQQGLETTWALQEADGGIFAGAGREHWKDTGIAMFSLVRQCELAQDWTYFREMRPALLKAAGYIRTLREHHRDENSAAMRYGLLPNGMGDGGLGGLRPEFTNIIWTLAGLKAVARAAERQRMDGLAPVRALYDELHSNFVKAASQEMRQHPAGFRFLPMLMKDDPQWTAQDEWARPRPQVAQWALSHGIYPGLLFSKDDPIVRGHIALMQACTQEDVPVETGWLPHEGTWTYNAPFVSHVYLWAGLDDWARRIFNGFLNHASPSWCWREEQPLRGSLAADYIGDMPHNWASAECVLYMRQMLALEDGDDLRLLAGIGAPELNGQPFELKATPTRFGRVSMRLEPAGSGWRLEFRREPGPTPAGIYLPNALGQGSKLTVSGATSKASGRVVSIDPAVSHWTAAWK